MFELAFIEQCADPSLEIAIVERFISEVGTDNPLVVTITDGNRLILPEAPRTKEAAMRLIERFVGQAVVRVGVTGYPAGHGISDVSELSPELVDACGNIRMGTALFGKVYRIVAHAHDGGSAAVFQAAVEAWGSGLFEGRYVFGEPDPGPLQVEPDRTEFIEDGEVDDPSGERPIQADGAAEGSQILDPHAAGIRVDLSGLQ